MLREIKSAATEYAEDVALINKKFNEDVEMAYFEWRSRLSLLMENRDRQLVAAWYNLMTTIIPLPEGDLSLEVLKGLPPGDTKQIIEAVGRAIIFSNP
jgi:hypothetical protein